MKAYLSVLTVTLFLFIVAKSNAQQVGDNVELASTNQSGVPVHPADGDTHFTRWPNGTEGKVVAIGASTGWRKVESNGVAGWVTTANMRVIPTVETESDETGNELESYVVGTWNLEYLHNTKGRGFPENGDGGDSYGPRTNADYVSIAGIIRDRLNAKILVLNEINGVSGTTRSNELDHLVRDLGGRWGYVLSLAGSTQRVAILFDSSAANCTKCFEIAMERREVQRDDIFARDPLVCSFTFLDHTGAARNDFLVVALHLASGQENNKNHDTAMAVLSRQLTLLTSNGTFSSAEKDILIAGDLNASRYDDHPEIFWTNLSPTRFKFKTLSPENGDDYPGTRLKGVPLAPTSQIDYILISGQSGGLVDEIAEPTARVRVDLLPHHFEDFREHLSDHIPVVVQVKVVPDND